MKHTELINCKRNTKCGNHRVEVEGDTSHLIYYATEIVTVNHAKREFSTIDYKISPSTSCAIGKYRNALTRMGYEEV